MEATSQIRQKLTTPLWKGNYWLSYTGSAKPSTTPWIWTRHYWGSLMISPLEKRDNSRLSRLKEKTLGWKFRIVYIASKKLS